MPAFCMRLPLYQRGKIQEEPMYYEHKKYDACRRANALARWK